MLDYVETMKHKETYSSKWQQANEKWTGPLTYQKGYWWASGLKGFFAARSKLSQGAAMMMAALLSLFGSDLGCQ